MSPITSPRSASAKIAISSPTDSAAVRSAASAASPAQLPLLPALAARPSAARNSARRSTSTLIAALLEQRLRPSR